MKKLMIAAAAAMFAFTASVMAESGTIEYVKVTPWSGVEIVLNDGSTLHGGSISSEVTGDNLKTFTATVLTALSTGNNVTMTRSGADSGWNTIQMDKQ